jgi:hypothetical protein
VVFVGFRFIYSIEKSFFVKRIRNIHPYVFALAGLIFVYGSTAVVASPTQLVRPLVVEWLILALLTWPINWIVRDRDWTAVLLTIFVLGFYASLLYFYVAGVISASVVIIWWIVSFLRKRKVKVNQITMLMNVSSVLLAIVFFARLIPLFDQVPWAQYRRAVTSLQENRLFLPDEPEKKPDIYYIVLDGYARSDILDELYGYDNSAFVGYLKDKGFVIPAESRSNYPKTALSVTSTLNMNYISALTPGLDDSMFWWLMAPLIDHSQARTILEQAGYNTIAIATDWSITDNPSTDRYYKPYPVHLNDFEGYLLAKTPLSALTFALKNVAFVPSFSAHRQLVEYNFEALANIPDNSGPKFIFAHIVSPHPPFVFDQDGNALNPEYAFSFNDANDFQGTKDEYRRGYVAQVEYVNKRLEKMIETILANSEVPPIIILQADHGPGMLTDFQSSANTCLKERFSTFAAYYFPGMDEARVPADISAVNVFRLVFNQYFEAEMPLLENRFYYYKDTIYIYRAEDVTAQIDRVCEIQP